MVEEFTLRYIEVLGSQILENLPRERGQFKIPDGTWENEHIVFVASQGIRFWISAPGGVRRMSEPSNEVGGGPPKSF